MRDPQGLPLESGAASRALQQPVRARRTQVEQPPFGREPPDERTKEGLHDGVDRDLPPLSAVPALPEDR